MWIISPLITFVKEFISDLKDDENMSNTVNENMKLKVFNIQGVTVTVEYPIDYNMQVVSVRFADEEGNNISANYDIFEDSEKYADSVA